MSLIVRPDPSHSVYKKASRTSRRPHSTSRQGAAPAAARTSSFDRPTPLDRLVGIVRCNDQLLVQLRMETLDLKRAHDYLTKPGCNADLAHVHISRVRTQRAQALTQLRANRLEAERILGIGRQSSREAIRAVDSQTFFDLQES